LIYFPPPKLPFFPGAKLVLFVVLDEKQAIMNIENMRGEIKQVIFGMCKK
jgi:hypothetical protein